MSLTIDTHEFCRLATFEFRKTYHDTFTRQTETMPRLSGPILILKITFKIEATLSSPRLSTGGVELGRGDKRAGFKSAPTVRSGLKPTRYQLKNGLWFFSLPIVVVGPWPGMTNM